MARARNIKPGIFKNELLGVADPFLTLLFESLWCLADKAGRLEDRPLRIKAETFPYRDGMDVNVYLTELQRLGFICRYSVDGVAYIQVVNFLKHQNPHKTERESEIPEYVKESSSCAITVIAPLNNGSRPADSLIPDSLIPDPLLKALGTSVPTDAKEDDDDEKPKAGEKIDEEFEHAWTLYPKRFGGNPKRKALHAWNARLREGHKPAEMIAGVERYAAHIKSADRLGTEFVKQAVTFFGPDKNFLEDWQVRAKSGAVYREADKDFSSNERHMQAGLARCADAITEPDLSF